MKTRPCFSCGAATRTTIQSKKLKGLRYICAESRCWNVYYREAAAK